MSIEEVTREVLSHYRAVVSWDGIKVGTKFREGKDGLYYNPKKEYYFSPKDMKRTYWFEPVYKTVVESVKIDIPEKDDGCYNMSSVITVNKDGSIVAAFGFRQYGRDVTWTVDDVKTLLDKFNDLDLNIPGTRYRNTSIVDYSIHIGCSEGPTFDKSELETIVRVHANMNRK